jgi:hypothetical protein
LFNMERCPAQCVGVPSTTVALGLLILLLVLYLAFMLGRLVQKRECSKEEYVALKKEIEAKTKSSSAPPFASN